MGKSRDERLDELKAKLPVNIANAVKFATWAPEAAHHAQWIIDQMLRSMLGPELYAEYVEAYETPHGPKGEREISNWDEGVAP